MKRIAVAAIAAMLFTGCNSVATKTFKVFADPPDAVIRVVSGEDLSEQKFMSPAMVTAVMPKDPSRAAQTLVEVKKDAYTPKVFALTDVQPGETLNVKLQKIPVPTVHYDLKFRMTAPVVSNEMQFKDKFISVGFTMTDQSIKMRLQNVTNRDIKILWERAQYTDVNDTVHRIMPSSVRFADRNNPMPDQIVISQSTVQETIYPVSSVFMSQQKRGYDLKTLFPVESDAAANLKGKAIHLFVPIEIDRSIIPYGFAIEIAESVRGMRNN